VNICEGFFNSL